MGNGQVRVDPQRVINTWNQRIVPATRRAPPDVSRGQYEHLVYPLGMGNLLARLPGNVASLVAGDFYSRDPNHLWLRLLAESLPRSGRELFRTDTSFFDPHPRRGAVFTSNTPILSGELKGGREIICDGVHTLISSLHEEVERVLRLAQHGSVTQDEAETRDREPFKLADAEGERLGTLMMPREGVYAFKGAQPDQPQGGVSVNNFGVVVHREFVGQSPGDPAYEFVLRWEGLQPFDLGLRGGLISDEANPDDPDGVSQLFIGSYVLGKDGVGNENATRVIW